ncbi:MAG: hypothetical protein HKN79_07555 [Flavobacteriales bacterium]|nr:hypothetical protein [Flavobacteriales bacterium]
MSQRKELSLDTLCVGLSLILLLFSCSDPSIDRTVEPIEVELELVRLDLEIFKEEPLEEKHERLREQHPKFYSQYFREILLLGPLDDSLALQNLERFVQDEEWQFAQRQIDSVFTDTEEYHQQFSEAFGRYKAIFPERKVPDVYFMNSGYNYGIYPIPQLDVLGIGAEFYLGASNPMIDRLPNELFPAYLREQMIPEHLVPNAMKGWLILNHDEGGGRADLLGLMASYGKIMYALHLCIPEIEEYRHFAYSEAEWNWCVDNEQNIWKVIIDQDILFTKERKTLTDWIGRGPYTQGFSEESPAELGYFMGKQMVKDYMREHPEVTVQQLMSVPAEAILKAYTPG